MSARDWPTWAVSLRAGLPDLLTREDAARVLRVTERTLDRWRRLGDLDSVAVGGRVLVPADAVVATLVAGQGRRAS